MTRRFRISLAPLGGGPENHLSGKKNGSVPHYPLTVLTRSALHLGRTRGGRLTSQRALVAPVKYGPLTLDYNERARGLTLVVSILAATPKDILKCSSEVWGHMHSATRFPDRSVPKDRNRGHSNVQEWPKIPGA